MKSPVLWIAAAVLVVGGVALGVRVGWRALAESPALVVEQVTVRGASAVSADEVIRRSGIHPGDSWFALDKAGAARGIRVLSRVHEVKIRRPWIGRVRIDVREYAPEARVLVRGREYGLCEDLRIVRASADERRGLPLIQCSGKSVDPDALERGLTYLEELRDQEVAEGEPVELLLDAKSGDRIRFPKLGFAASIDPPVSPEIAVKNVGAFLETLDEQGGSRGTLRLISESTAVWRASA